MALKRIKRELKEIKKDCPEFCTVTPDERNLFKWQVTISGPADTPYENGIFKLKIFFPRDYPFSPPKVSFLTKIYHPNVNNSGRICLDILLDSWSPALTITTILLSISSLLCDPNADNPFNYEAAVLYRKNKEKYNKVARSWTERYAK